MSAATSKIREWRHDHNKFVREVFGVTPDPWQEDALAYASQSGRLRLGLKACAGPGKMQPKSMMFYTPKGLTRWGDIKPGDLVFAEDGSATRVVNTFDNGVKPMYRVTFNDGSSTLAGAEHLWKVRGRTERRHGTWSVLTTEQIIKRNDCHDGMRRQFEIPQQGVVEFPHAGLGVDPYVMGCWLGDGTRLKGQISTADDEILGEIEFRGYDISNIDGVMVNILGLAPGLRKAGVLKKYSYEKFVPEAYKMSSAHQRTELLHGLMDTDGCIDANDASCEFSTTSRALADDVVWLVRSLGGKARIKPTVKKCGYKKDGVFIPCRDCYRVTVTTPFNPFTVGRKHERWRPKQDRYLTRYIESIEPAPAEDAMCIEVEHESRCYLANDFIVTHNTALLAWEGWARLALYAAPNEHPKGAAVSITQDNLDDNLWAELARWQNASPFLLEAFQWTKRQIFAKDHPETWFLSNKGWAKSADPETIGRTLSGQHSRFPFYLIDESGDIPPNMSKSAEQGLTSCEDGIIITAGNTTSHTGLLYDVTTRGRTNWHIISITADPDDPKRTPRVDAEWAREQIALYGRDNPWVMAYILGQFPPGSINALLGVGEVEAAMGRFIKPEAYEWAQKRIGVDVARFGDDRTVLFPRQGLCSFQPAIMRHPRDSSVSVDIASRVMHMKNEIHAETEFFDDTVGWAHGAIDVLRAAGHSPYAIRFDAPANDDRYRNMRAEMWMKMADWIKTGGAIPNIPEMVAELTSPTYFFANGKFQIESKDQIKKRLGRSPDLADALALTFAIPDMPRAMHQLLPNRGQGGMKSDFDPFSWEER